MTRPDHDRGGAPGTDVRRLVLYFDGASRGNPGPSAYGVYSPSGLRVAEAIGQATNNVAEWRGFVAALKAAVEAGAKDVEIRADSQLVVLQFKGVYRLRARHLLPYLEEARRLSQSIASLRVVHVPREENREADALANAALDRQRSIGDEADRTGRP